MAERVVFVAKKASEAISECTVSKNFHGGSMPQFPKQMCVMCAWNVPMLCPCNFVHPGYDTEEWCSPCKGNTRVHCALA